MRAVIDLLMIFLMLIGGVLVTWATLLLMYFVFRGLDHILLTLWRGI
jgi:hypothetical protein